MPSQTSVERKVDVVPRGVGAGPAAEIEVGAAICSHLHPKPIPGRQTRLWRREGTIAVRRLRWKADPDRIGERWGRRGTAALRWQAGGSPDTLTIYNHIDVHVWPLGSLSIHPD